MLRLQRSVVLFGVMATFAIAAMGCTGLQRVQSDPPVEETRALIGGATHITYTYSHGTQVEYNAPDGQTFLWYPGNKVILSGHWSVKQHEPYRVSGPADTKLDIAQNVICFRYGENTYNPATGHRGAGPECRRTRYFQSLITETRRGDVLGLAQRKEVPFVLSRLPASIDTLVARVGAGSR